MKYRYRRLTINDLDAIMEVQGECYEPDFQESRECFARKLWLYSDGTMGVFADKRLLGYVFTLLWRIGEPFPLHACDLWLPENPNCLHIHDLCTRPEARGQKLAYCLYDEMVVHAIGIEQSILTLIAVQNSESFWYHMGFDKVGTVIYNEQPAAVMQNDLNLGPID